MPSWKKLLVHGGSGSLAHLKLENLTSQNVLGTDAQGNIVAGSVSGYTLPTATDSILGGVKVGGTLIISNGVLSARTYTGATAAVIGGAAGVDGIAGYVPAATSAQSTYFLRGDGTWAVPTNTVTRLRSSAGTNYLSGDLMITGSGATSVSVAGSTFTISTAAPTPYSLPIATASTLGGIKIGSGLTIDRETGVVTAAAGTSLSADRVTFYTGSLSLNGAGATTVSYVPQLGGFVISSTDTNTTYSAGTGLTLSGTTFSVTPNTYASATHTHDDRYLRLSDTGSFFDRIIDSAPGTLDTLNELAAAIGDDANFSASIAGVLARKSEIGHNHDDRYYTETEVNTLLAGKAAATHSHDYDNYGYWEVADRTTSTRLESTNTLTILGDGATTVSLNTENNTLTISSTDNDTTYSQATSSTLGLVKIGYTANAKNYPVALDGSGKMYVNVPWTDTDTNTTYSAGTGLTLTGTTFSVTADTYAAATHTHTIRDIESLEDELNGKQAAGDYAAATHTHTAATTSAAGFMSATDKTKLNGIASGANNYSLPLATASVRGGVKIGYTANGKNYPVQLSSEQMYVNVPWTDTDTDTITKVGVPDDLSTGDIEFRGDGATTITKSGNTITISSTDTDTNTTYSAGTGLTLSGTTFSVTANTYAAAAHTHDDRYYTETESDARFARKNSTDSTELLGLTTIDVDLTLTTEWQSTGIRGGNLSTGTYIVQVYANDYAVGGGHYTEYYSGTMSWYGTTTNSAGTDEIVLHRAGHAPNSGRIYLRTKRTAAASDGNMYLEMAGDSNNSGSSRYVFKFRRLI